MRKTWNVGFLLSRAAGWILALGVVLPVGFAITLFLASIWLIWMATEWLYSLVMWLSIPAAQRDAPGTRVYGAGVVRLGPGDRRMIELSPPQCRTAELTVHAPGPRRQSVDDIQRSLAGMARYGWSKEKVLRALEGAGAAWMWSERVDPRQIATGSSSQSIVRARERVHLHYRPGNSIFQRYTMPAARIDVWFDQAGRLLQGYAHQNQRM